MNILNWIQSFLLVGLIILFTPILGNYIANIYKGVPTLLTPMLGWLERFSYRVSGVNPLEEMSWKRYLKELLLFNAIGLAALFLLQEIQGFLPLNPQGFSAIAWPLAFNTASSFVTNTNWQAYAGETTLSYFVQMLGLTVQNFLSAATGLAALFALIRGLTRKCAETLGNFWSDLVKSTIYLLLPLSFVLALVLVSQGVIQTLSPYATVTTLENRTQVIPLGPVASQVAIKQLGTNGGGFFNTNSAHPFENPNALTNFLETLALVLIPAASTYTFGVIIGSRKHGWLLFLVMILLWIGGAALSLYAQWLPNTVLNAYPMKEGIETRFGIDNSIFWSTLTTSAANGSVNAMISSLAPLSGGVALFNIMLDEVVFGGMGVGLAGMIMYVLLTVFISGLMVGRTPEYLGKKIEKQEMQWVMISILMPGALILIGSSLAVSNAETLSSLGNLGPHGLTEILYAFTSASGNNGSSFAGLNANTDFYNLSLGVVMLLSRLAIIVPAIAVAGLLAHKKITPQSVGTFSTDTFLFALMLIGIILIVGALTFFPAISLGPLVEHFLMQSGRAF